MEMNGSWNEYITALPLGHYIEIILAWTNEAFMNERHVQRSLPVAAFVFLSCPFHIPIHSHYDNLHPPQQRNPRPSGHDILEAESGHHWNW